MVGFAKKQLLAIHRRNCFPIAQMPKAVRHPKSDGVHHNRKRIHAGRWNSARVRNQIPTRSRGMRGRIRRHLSVAVLHKTSSRKNMGMKGKYNSKS